MEVFDLKKIKAYPYKERDKNVFFKSKRFKARIIKLHAGESMPTCEMQSSVVFYVIEGTVELHVNEDIQNIKEGMCMITGPATLSLKTEEGVLIAGFQINE
ncbi:MAG: hypothetical protein JXB88_18865 [Spirochaetales bacterium]|nr:hypothetical protein [Spirochaetales bacterium]